MTRRSRAEMIALTRAKLLAAARQSLVMQGYSSLSMEEITAKADLTRGALYHHFGGKEGLLIAVIGQIESEIAERLRLVAEAAPTPWEGFRRRCRTYLEMAMEPEIRRILLQDARAVLGNVPQASQNAAIAGLQVPLEGLIEEGVLTASHAGVLARMIYGAIAELSFWIAETETDHSARLAEALIGLDRLLDGLKAA